MYDNLMLVVGPERFAASNPTPGDLTANPLPGRAWAAVDPSMVTVGVAARCPSGNHSRGDGGSNMLWRGL